MGPFEENDHGDMQRAAFISTFALIAKLVCSDGTMDKKELILVNQVMTQTMKLDEDRKAYATKIFNETKRAEVTVSELVEAYKSALHTRPKMYEWLLDVLVRLSLADEVLLPEEEQFLNEVCTLLGFDEHKVDEIKSRYVTFSKDDAAYAVLGISLEGNTRPAFTEVQNAYNRCLKKYDVETLIELGFGAELIELASQKQAECTSAFLKIKNEIY